MKGLFLGWRRSSMLKRVLVPMLVVFVLTVVVSATVVRRVSLHELEEVLSANLGTSAESLFGVLRSELQQNDVDALQGIIDRYSERDAAATAGEGSVGFDTEQARLRYTYLQLWLPGMDAMVSSRDRVLIPERVQQQGFFLWSEGQRVWQMVGINDPQSGAWFYMGQRDDYWQEVQQESTVAMALALVLLSPLLALVIWFGVVRGLRPLRELSAEIDRREGGKLQPLQVGDQVAETQPLVRAINELLQRLTAALENERQFTADAAHELRTPIASLRAQLGVLEGARSEQERAGAVQNIDRATERMANLVSNLLALARLDAGEALPHEARYCLRASLEEVIAEHAFAALEKNVEISLHGLPACELHGAAYLHELLAANLIANAIKYTPAGGQVDVYLEAAEGRYSYRVEDTGPGVPERELATLTERFRRVRSSGGESADGAGLGLSIAAKCAQLAAAQLHLSNRPEGGLCARVQL